MHRRDSFRAEKILQERLFKNPKVEVVWNWRRGGAGLGRSQDRQWRGAEGRAGATTTEIDLDGVFIAIGHAPATELFKGRLETTPSGYLITAPDSTRTSIPGVFAAGDVKDEVFRRAVTAAGMGCMDTFERSAMITRSKAPQGPL